MNDQVGLPVPRVRAGEFVVRMAAAIGASACASAGFPPPVS